MKKNNIAKIAVLFLGLLIIFNFLWQVYTYRNDIFKKFNSGYWTMRYKESQWVVPNSKNSIGDDGLYMYAGYRYMQGDDPTLLNAEYPPLGKYIIGFFEITTGYMNMFSLFFGGVVLLLFYLFNRQIFKSNFFALLPVMIFSFDPLFTSQIRAAYLDTLYLSALLTGFLFFLRKNYIFSGVALGVFMSIKAPFLITIVYSVIILYLLVEKKFSLKNVLFMSISSLTVFFFSYTVTFLHGHSLLYFLRVQKYIIHFYATGAKAVIGAIFPMLLIDKWYTWFNTVQRVQEWTVFWPIVVIGGVVAFFIWMKKKNHYVFFQLLWCGVYCIFLIFTPIFPRYLLLLLPFLYNLSIWSLSAVIKPKSF